MKLRLWILAAVPSLLVLLFQDASAIDRRIPALAHIVKRYSNDAPRLAKLSAKPIPKGATFILPSAGSAADPTIHGGSLRFFKIGTPGAWPLINLRASRWLGLGSPAGSDGYRYAGRGSVGDPCRSVLITPKRIKATCKTFTAVSMSLYTMPVAPSPGVGWELNVGGDRYCAESSTATGAQFRKNTASSMKAVRANAPLACPVASTPTPTPTPTPSLSPTPTPAYGSAARAFVTKPASLVR